MHRAIDRVHRHRALENYREHAAVAAESDPRIECAKSGCLRAMLRSAKEIAHHLQVFVRLFVHRHVRALFEDHHLGSRQRVVAERRCADAGLAAQAARDVEGRRFDFLETVSGDFFSEELPKGSDTILLSMILHDWGPDKNRAILRKCFDTLPSGGAIIISELMMDDDKCGPPPAALMAMTMIIVTEGRNYTWAEYEEWLKEQASYVISESHSIRSALTVSSSATNPDARTRSTTRACAAGAAYPV